MNSKSPTQLDQMEIGLKEMFDILWRGRWLIVCTSVLCALAAGVAAWAMPKTYQATAVISPVSESSGSQLSGMSSLTSQFSGLASLAGITVGADSKKLESLAVLQSEVLTEKYIKDNGLLPILFEDKWDKAAENWKAVDRRNIPTLWKANEMFKKQVRVVSSNTKTGMVQLAISWKDPYVAAKWANDLVGVTNDYLRNKAIVQSEKNIAYLNDQASKTDAVGVKQAIYAILQSEVNKVMLARGSDEYAFKVIDPASPPEKPSSPQKLLWILGGFFIGFGLSAFAAFVRNNRHS